MRVAEAEAEVVENGRGKCFFLAAMAEGVFSTKRDDLDFFRVVLGVFFNPLAPYCNGSL